MLRMIAVMCFCLAHADASLDQKLSYLMEWKLYSPAPIAASEMEKDCTQVLTSRPDLNRKTKGAILLRRGVLNYFLDKPEETASDIREAAQLDPDSTEIQFELGRVYIRAEMIEEAKQIAIRLQKTYPADFRGFFLMGKYFETTTDFIDAIEQHSTAARLNPEYQYIVLSRAWCYHRLAMWDECIADTDEALRKAPCIAEYTNYSLFMMRSISLSKKSRHGDAVASAIKARDLNPESKHAWLNLWYCLACAKRPAASLRVMELCVERFPADPDVLARLAASELENDRIELAAQHASESLRLDVKNHVAYNVLGRIALAEGKWKDAYQHLDKACTLSRYDFDALARIALLWSTCPEEKYRNRKGAVAVFKAFEREAGWSVYDPHVRIVLACIAADSGEFDEALAELDKFEKTVPKGDVPNGVQQLRALFKEKKPYVMSENRDKRLFDLPLSIVAELRRK